MELNPTEVRVLGSLVEKDLTTPDYYPLTLSALTAACNQKSNRDPVMSVSETQVIEALDGLTRRNLAWEKGSAGGRVPRYAHKLSGTLTRTYDFSRQELATLAVLFLRGPQTPGEIRARAPRSCEFQSLAEVEATLRALEEREAGPFVVQLPREAGRRESRFAHLFGGPVEVPAASGTPELQDPSLAERVTALEQRVAELSAEVAALRDALAALPGAAAPS
jgi:hypothetical protein